MDSLFNLFPRGMSGEKHKDNEAVNQQVTQSVEKAEYVVNTRGVVKAGALALDITGAWVLQYQFSDQNDRPGKKKRRGKDTVDHKHLLVRFYAPTLPNFAVHKKQREQPSEEEDCL